MFKRFAAILLASVMVLATAFTSYAAYFTDYTTNAYTQGIDVSKYQNDIDWAQVASDGVQFAMIRTRHGGVADAKFYDNVQGAVDNGIKIGAYLYSTAQSVEESEADADFVINLIKDYPFSYPIAIDIESTVYHWNMDGHLLSDIINAFCNKIKAAGYYPIIYTNDYWIHNKLEMDEISQWPIWYARYVTQTTYKNYEMWQASSSGSIAGIEGNVDLDFCYANYDMLIPANSWKYINGETLFYRNYMKVTSDWINDNGTWYYIDSKGHYVTGWYKDPSNTYYYLGDDGKMRTNWQTIGDGKFYFANDGAMRTGLVELDGKLYYFNNDGYLQTGVQKLNGNLYYFGTDGVMQLSGQTEYGGKVYDINADGTMTEYIPPQTETAAADAAAVGTTTGAPAL